jgi:hypothetical protein
MRRRVVTFDPSDPREVKAAVREVLELADDAGVRVTTSIARSYVKAEHIKKHSTGNGRGSQASGLWAPGGKLRVADDRRKAARADLMDAAEDETERERATMRTTTCELLLGAMP